MSTRQPACNQQFKTHTTQHQDGGCVKPPSKEDHKHFVFFHPSTKRRVKLVENGWIRQLKDQYHQLVKKSKPPDHTDPVNFQGSQRPYNVLPHSNVQQPRATTSNWIERGESAKNSNGTQQHN